MRPHKIQGGPRGLLTIFTLELPIALDEESNTYIRVNMEYLTDWKDFTDVFEAGTESFVCSTESTYSALSTTESWRPCSTFWEVYGESGSSAKEVKTS